MRHLATVSNNIEFKSLTSNLFWRFYFFKYIFIKDNVQNYNYILYLILNSLICCKFMLLILMHKKLNQI